VAPEITIAATNLGRDYGNVAAVDSIDLDVREGELFGFLGPNGAGKTTTIRMLTTLLRPSRGEARVAGNDVVNEPLAVRRAIGVVFQETTLDLDLTAEENLRFCARLYGLSRRETKIRVAEALSLFGLDERRRERVRAFSGGMQRALDLARGILHSPAILFLDEPTLGLDPPQRRRVWDHLGHLREEYGTTIFLTTHYLEEADPCDRIAIIDEGRIVVRGEPEQLKRQLGNDRIELDGARFPGDLNTLRAEARRLTGREPNVNGRTVFVAVDDYAQTLHALLPLATDGVEVRLRQATLDDVFIEATRRRDGDGDG
jgi:ABC-2 type transport system ATP-binding protein